MPECTHNYDGAHQRIPRTSLLETNWSALQFIHLKWHRKVASIWNIEIIHLQLKRLAAKWTLHILLANVFSNRKPIGKQHPDDQASLLHHRKNERRKKGSLVKIMVRPSSVTCSFEKRSSREGASPRLNTGFWPWFTRHHSHPSSASHVPLCPKNNNPQSSIWSLP